MKNWGKIFFWVVILALLVGMGYYFRADLFGWFRFARTELEVKVEQLKEIEQKIVTPSPLRGPTEEVVSNLTSEGTVEQTNIQRAQNNLASLSINAQLTAMAQAKVDDMFTNQYFAHESPIGEGPGDLAKSAGYEYIMVGENLALGNFKDDMALVDAWMNSPGHRENILNSEYTEIGVAVKRGVYEGHTTWLAVQEFGRPTSDCPFPSEVLNTQIEENQILLLELEKQLENKSSELKSIRPRRGNVYNQKVEEYNEMVNQYNAFLEDTKTLISDYNNRVKLYNACVEGA